MARIVFIAGIPETPKSNRQIENNMNRRSSQGSVKHVRKLIQNTEETDEKQDSLKTMKNEYRSTRFASRGKAETAICVKG